MADRILTTHVGSLPRPAELIAADHSLIEGESIDTAAYADAKSAAVIDVVARQKAAGIDWVNDGEYGHQMGYEYDYGAWWSYIADRLGGIEVVPTGAAEAAPVADESGELKVAAGGEFKSREWTRFAEAYADPKSGCAFPEMFFSHYDPVVKGPLSYTGHAQLQVAIDDFKAGLEAAGLTDGWMNSVAPNECARFTNEHYATREEQLFACADALHEEYKGIIDAGLSVQLDAPVLACEWDQHPVEPTPEEYRKYLEKDIEALNHALRGLPPERVRLHMCWGSWHGPHVTDMPMAYLVDVMLAINAGSYTFEAGNVRHEHEWRLWNDVKLPDGKKIMPGVVSHSTNAVEHPEVVADRLIRYAEAVGRENVLGSTDCGLGGRVHPQIAWAKLEALAQGAELASSRLW